MTPPVTADLSALLDRLEAAAAAATRPRWAVTDPDRPWLVFSPYRLGPVADCSTRADAALIVAAVTALPTLVAELRAHQAAVQAVREVADSLIRDAAAFQYAAPGSYDAGVRTAYEANADRIRAAVAALDPKGDQS